MALMALGDGISDEGHMAIILRLYGADVKDPTKELSEADSRQLESLCGYFDVA